MKRSNVCFCLMIAAFYGFTLEASAIAYEGASKNRHPNIVFVLFDDIGYGQPPSYRAESKYKTPNIDRLAETGMRFTDAHSAAANCTPTRYGLLTGRYPFRIGRFSVVLGGYPKPLIPKERLTVGSFLKQHGYHTACIGKWHLGLNHKAGTPGNHEVGSMITDGPTTLGFDYFSGYHYHPFLGKIIEQDTVWEHIGKIENEPTMVRKAVAWIESQSKSDSPFFLYFPMCPPHNPTLPAPEFIGKGGLSGADGEYSDWVHQGDHMLGQILDALERTGQTENTLIIATGDNGAADHAFPPLRESKSSIYEGGHREPFVASWRGKIEPGSVCEHTICLNDLFATCADILGEKLPDNAAEDSVSILPCLLGAAIGPIREATVHQGPGKPKGDLAIRQGPWKLVFLKNGTRELYNLQNDVSETQNLAGKKPGMVQHMTKLMQSYIERGRSTPGASQKNEFNLVLDEIVPASKSKNRRRKRSARTRISEESF